MLDVLIIVSSDPLYDSRSSKYLSCLLEAGYTAKVIGISSDRTFNDTESCTRVPITRQSGKRFFIQFYQRVIPEVKKSHAKVVLAGDLFSVPPSIIGKMHFSRQFNPVSLIYDSKELYKELPSLKAKRTSFLFWNIVEKVSIHYIDHVLTVNKSISDILRRTWHLPTDVIMNVPDIVPTTTICKRPLDKITLAFSGGLQDGRGLGSLIRLLALLPEKFEVKFIGDGALRPELERLAASLNLSHRVKFVGKVRNSEVIGELSKATLGVYLMEDSGLCHYLALPNKLFQFIAARLPVVVSAFPEMQDIVQKYRIGAAVDPADTKTAAMKILEMTSDESEYQKLVENCDNAARILNWQMEKEKFLRVIRSLV